ncbi:MAG: dihydroneopterin aldolase [Parafilimonas sp.]
MLKIHLSGLRFHSFHGIHEEEKKIGGEFEVNASLLYEPKSIPVRYMTEIIDYTTVYRLIKDRMDVPTPLLETLATEIASDIFSSFLQVEDVILEIKKVTPPLTGFEGSISVSYELKRYTRRQH